jgi:hypothetical protein
MKRFCLALINLLLALTVTGQAAGQDANVPQNRFKYELHTAQSGALQGAARGNTHANDLVHTVFVDSRGRVFVGTENGLAVYDGNQWTKRTFTIKGLSSSERGLLNLFAISECGPKKIVEGPPGTIWLGGSGCGVWRLRDDLFDEIGPSSLSSYLGMAVDHGGSLWVVTRDRVQKYDGRAWSEVLSPYIVGTAHRELPQLYGVVIGTNGSVWIGGTVYGDAKPPWEHTGAVWVVDQEQRKRADGPPMAGLYEFDGNGWRAFGPPHGLGIEPRDTVIPELDGQGRVIVKTRNRHYIRDGENWIREDDLDVYSGKRWVLRSLGTSKPPGYFAELLFRENGRLIPVRPTDHRTAEVLELASEPLRVLRMAEDQNRGCIWLGTMHGLYRIWPEKEVSR